MVGWRRRTEGRPGGHGAGAASRECHPDPAGAGGVRAMIDRSFPLASRTKVRTYVCAAATSSDAPLATGGDLGAGQLLALPLFSFHRGEAVPGDAAPRRRPQRVARFGAAAAALSLRALGRASGAMLTGCNDSPTRSSLMTCGAHQARPGRAAFFLPSQGGAYGDETRTEHS